MDKRDASGELTPDSLALRAIRDAGCNCGNYGPCALCLCHKAIWVLRNALQRERAVRDAATDLTSWDWEHLLIDHPDAQVVMDGAKKLEDALLEKRG